MRFASLALVHLLSFGVPSVAPAADPPASETLDLWPGAAPGETGEVGPEVRKGENPVTSITNVTKPSITVTRPAPDKNTGAAIVVCPGGGYNALAWDHEGEQVARWLNDLGVTAAVLKYRVPRRPGSPKDQPPPQALMDAQRALSLVRSHANDWSVDASRVGILGFSAGGHLAAWAATNPDPRTYSPVDAADTFGSRPDFVVLIYPGGLLKGDQLSPEIHVTSQTPPTFFAHANDDPVPPQGSARLYLAMKEAGVPAELHIYNSGGHGFGMRASPHPSSHWSDRCAEWLADRGLLRPAPTP